ncbi:hypothetical protein [Streptomyces wuyuanensis]|uniref:Uncharacterized protein n=1 Tax=Streptomyces wuyuanensis TaxID=1196353 RepID=A0A1H0B8F0_9ACTN|nr:hypothetical protein [Streptomyces wuyuanensis]SDN41881.1 hypothetical protein SAMN05444921_126107 [Streptomyces wuyuanensis]
MSLPARYLGYVGYFVGAGLISGAVVHHPLDPDRYTRMAGYGALVVRGSHPSSMTSSSPASGRVCRACWWFVAASLMLSFGIGMLSGGLQHFADFPGRGAVLVPLGLTVSFVAYVIKDADTPWQRIFSLVGLTVLIASVVAFVGLRHIASSVGELGEGAAIATELPRNRSAGWGTGRRCRAAPGAPDVPTPRRSPTEEGAGESTAGHGDGHSH